MKLTIQTPKPRNPLVAASLRRRAGAHTESAGARRQQARSAMRRELAALDHRHPPTP